MFKQKLLLCASILLFSISGHADRLIIEPEMGHAPILSTIQNTKSSINIVMYGFTDSEVMDALKDSQKSGKKINVLLEKSPYKNPTENSVAAKKLKSANVNLQWANPEFKLTHQKTIISDHKTALIMTFNLTHSSFNNERNFALMIDDPAKINEIERVFHADWDNKKISTNNPDLVWSPYDSRKKLLDFIHKAKSSIEIYAQEITDYKTIGALADAARKGVKVDILTSATPSNKNRKKYEFLTHAGVKMHFNNHYYIHAKVIIVDHRDAMIGSMNLTKASIDDNRELSIITHNAEIVQMLENTFAHDCGKKTSLGSKIRWWLQTENNTSPLPLAGEGQG